MVGGGGCMVMVLGFEWSMYVDVPTCTLCIHYFGGHHAPPPLEFTSYICNPSNLLLI